MTCDLFMKKFSYNKILCDLCGTKGDFYSLVK
nr:MAG TPA: F420H2 dehydrogenase subunit [Bacteriophage sp.]